MGGRDATTNQPGALLGDVAPTDLGVRLVVSGDQSGPRAQVPGAGEAGDVADLGHEHRRQHPIQVHHHRVADRRGKNIARVAAARKLLTLVY